MKTDWVKEWFFDSKIFSMYLGWGVGVGAGAGLTLALLKYQFGLEVCR